MAKLQLKYPKRGPESMDFGDSGFTDTINPTKPYISDIDVSS